MCWRLMSSICQGKYSLPYEVPATFPFGVQTSYSASLLSNLSCTMCYDKPYSHATTSSDVESCKNAGYAVSFVEIDGATTCQSSLKTRYQYLRHWDSKPAYVSADGTTFLYYYASYAYWIMGNSLGSTSSSTWRAYISSSMNDVPASGWQESCSGSFYASGLTARVAGGWIAMGSKSSSSATSFDVLAFIPASDLVPSSSTSQAYGPKNGVYWYYYNGMAVGFASSSSICLGCNYWGDWSGTDCNKRLSWHLTGEGGWRSGCTEYLNSDSTRRKLMYSCPSVRSVTALTHCFDCVFTPPITSSRISSQPTTRHRLRRERGGRGTTTSRTTTRAANERSPPKSACAGDAVLRTSTRGTVHMDSALGYSRFCF